MLRTSNFSSRICNTDFKRGRKKISADFPASFHYYCLFILHHQCAWLFIQLHFQKHLQKIPFVGVLFFWQGDLCLFLTHLSYGPVNALNSSSFFHNYHLKPEAGWWKGSVIKVITVCHYSWEVIVLDLPNKQWNINCLSNKFASARGDLTLHFHAVGSHLQSAFKSFSKKKVLSCKAPIKGIILY